MSTLFKSKIFQPLKVQEDLRFRGVSLFTPREFSRLYRTTPAKAKYFLETYTKRGLFTRLKKGLYALKIALPGERAIANALYKPSYISFEYALAKYGIIPESVYTITSATSKATCSFEVRDLEFSYAKIKKQAFTGYAPVKEGDETILIAEPEKALVDYLYFVSLGKSSLNDRLYTSQLDEKKAIKYAQLFNRPGLMTLIKKIFLKT